MFDTRITGRLIMEKRKLKDMTQVELADKMGVSYQAVSNWERGGSMPDISKLSELGEVLSMSVDELLGGVSSTKTIKNVIEHVNGGEATQTTLKEFADIAPILKPSLADGMLESILDGEEVITIEDIESIAPFVSEAYLKKFLEKTMDIKKLSDISPLAPFIDGAYLGELIDNFEHEVSLKDLTSLLPFLEEAYLDKLVEKAMENEALDDCDELFPFLSSATMHKLAEKVLAEKGVKGLRNMAPFL